MASHDVAVKLLAGALAVLKLDLGRLWQEVSSLHGPHRLPGTWVPSEQMIPERTQELCSIVQADRPWYHVGGDDSRCGYHPSLAAILGTIL